MKLKLISILVMLILTISQSSTFLPKEETKIKDDIFISELEIFNDNKHIALATMNNGIIIYDIELKKEKSSISYPKNYGGITINSINDKKNLLTITESGLISIWNIDNTNAPLKEIQSTSKLNIKAYTLTTDNKYLYINSKDGIKVFDINKGIEVKTINFDKKVYNNLIISNDNKFLFFLSSDNIIYKKNIETGKTIKKFKENEKPISTIILTKNNKTLLSGTEDGKINIWDTNSGEKIRTVEIKKEKYKLNKLDSIIISNDDKYVLANLPFQDNQLWEINTGKLIKSFKNPTTVIYDINFSTNGDFIIGISSTNKIIVFDTKFVNNEIKPFGLLINKHLPKTINFTEIDNSNMVIINNIPKPNKIFKTYGASLNKNKIVISIAAIGYTKLNDDFCLKSTEDYLNIKEILSNKYGLPTDSYDYLRTGSIWEGRNYYKMSLYKNERVHLNRWDNIDDNPKLQIILEEDATIDGCYIRLTYRNKELVKANQKKQLEFDSNSF